ncbi:MAG: carboxypeptidase-like regulatory domain-containing protein [Terracidiphilus sp.]
MRLSRPLLAFGILICIFFGTHSAIGQNETATISGLIVDSSGALVRGAAVELQSVQRGTVMTTRTNDAGIYILTGVVPGQYRVTVRRQGFKQVDLVGLTANVQDHIEQNFKLQVGSVSESVTVEAQSININTTDASVSTVIDRDFVANMPLNGRSLQDLEALVPARLCWRVHRQRSAHRS